jgi:hypothetical protein
MPLTFRVASFNVENLFDRAKLSSSMAGSSQACLQLGGWRGFHSLTGYTTRRPRRLCQLHCPARRGHQTGASHCGPDTAVPGIDVASKTLAQLRRHRGGPGSASPVIWRWSQTRPDARIWWNQLFRCVMTTIASAATSSSQGGAGTDRTGPCHE